MPGSVNCSPACLVSRETTDTAGPLPVWPERAPGLGDTASPWQKMHFFCTNKSRSDLLSEWPFLAITIFEHPVHKPGSFPSILEYYWVTAEKDLSAQAPASTVKAGGMPHLVSSSGEPSTTPRMTTQALVVTIQFVSTEPAHIACCDRFEMGSWWPSLAKSIKQHQIEWKHFTFTSIMQQTEDYFQTWPNDGIFCKPKSKISRNCQSFDLFKIAIFFPCWSKRFDRLLNLTPQLFSLLRGFPNAFSILQRSHGSWVITYIKHT